MKIIIFLLFFLVSCKSQTLSDKNEVNSQISDEVFNYSDSLSIALNEFSKSSSSKFYSASV